MKPWKVLLLVIVAIVVGGVAYGYSLIRRGFSARGTPSAIETLAATTMRRLAVPSNYRQLRNPFPTSPENIQAGMEHFADHCATCHANDGGGDTLFGKGLYPKPPDMRTAETQNKSDGELFYTIENGVRLTGMPAFGEEHSVSGGAETWHLVLFIRHLPQITSEELMEMKGLNPKTDADRAEEQLEQEFLNGGELPKQVSGEEHHH
jgi:mono/diheme cytochrome c family protein